MTEFSFFILSIFIAAVITIVLEFKYPGSMK